MKKILLTGLEETNLKAAKLLKVHGFLPVHFPLQKMKKLNNFPIPKKEFDWITFTSSTAVRMASQEIHNLANNYAVVGPSTDQALSKKGYSSSLIPKDNYSAEGLIEVFKVFKDPLKILYPASKIAQGSLEKGLTELGHEVTRVNIYQPEEVSVNKLPDFTDATFFSPSGVDLFFKNFGKFSLENKKAVAIGKSTATAFEEHFGFKPYLAKESTVAGVIQTLL